MPTRHTGRTYYSTMVKFSERIGLKEPRSVFQIEDIDDDLRVQLWNVLKTFVLDPVPINHGFISKSSSTYRLFRLIWIDHFKKALDTLTDYWKPTYEWFRKWFFGAEWTDIYDLIDFIVQNHPDVELRDVLAQAFNDVLEIEMSGYRFVDYHLTRITSNEEVSAIQQAINSGEENDPHVMHLSRSLSLLTDRQNPDYRNSIKESISSVEATCRLISDNPKADLGDALRVLEDRNAIHPAFKGAISKLYGWTSDDGGIRHALTDDNEPDQIDAIFMLVACSAFVNYLLGKKSLLQ